MAGGKLSHAVESSADALFVRNVGIYMRSDDKYQEVKDLDAAGIYASRGTLSAEGCAITIDHSNQTLLNVANNFLTGCPRGIRLEKDVTAARLSDVDVSVTGSQVVELLSSSSGLTSSDKAYALYSESQGDVVVAGGSFAAVSAHGTATALYAASLTLEPGADGGSVEVSADAGNEAVGIRSASAQGVLLDAPISFVLPSTYLPATEAALASAVENAFVIGSRFSTSGASVLIGATSSEANGDSVRIATFSADVSAEACHAAAGMLENALIGGACAIRQSGDGLRFELDAAMAPACIVTAAGEEVPYGSVEEAISAVRSGQTVKLLKDAGDIVFSEGTSRNSFSLDLNGMSVRTLEVSSKASVRVFSSAEGTRARISGFSSSFNGAVSYTGEGTLEIVGIDITCTSRASDVSALSVTGSGDVILEDVSIKAVSQTTAARGINQSSGSASITLRESTILATTTEPGVAAYGIASSTSGSTISLETCEVYASSVDGTTGGLSTRSTLGVSKSTVEARTERAASTVWAMRATASSAKVTVETCTLRTLCDADASAGAYWCLMAGGSAPSNAASWTLDGACSFESANDTHLSFSETPVTIGASFSTSERIVVYPADLSDDVAFVASEGASLSGLASRFSVCAASSYEGCSLSMTDEGSLRLIGQTVAQNTTTGTSYRSIAEALSQAEDGQTIRLTANCETKETLDVSASITLDLNGRTLKVSLASDALSSSTSALDLASSSDVTITNGSIDVTMQAGTAAVARDGQFSAVKLSSGTSLTLDDAAVSLSFSSSASGSGSTTAASIDVGAGSLRLAGSSSVSVSAEGPQAARTMGIDVSGASSAGAVMVGSSCKVSASNQAQTQQQGSVSFASSSTSSNSAPSNARLLRVELEEGTELYDEVQSKFKENALLDISGDSEGYLYGTRMYYAAPLTLDDGTYVWAFADPLDASATFDLEGVKATYVYFQSYYDAVPDAYGIYSDGSQATLKVDGDVSAASDEGSAYALYVDGSASNASGKATVTATARLSAKGGTEAYRKDCGSLDLREDLNLDVAGTSKIVYPFTGSYTLVELTEPEAAVVGGGAAASVSVSGSASVSATGGDGSQITAEEPPDYFPDTVEVTFTNMRDASGSLLADQTRTQVFGSTLGEGGQAPEASDYVRDGITYRFVGWSVSMRSAGTRTVSSASAEDGLTLDTSAYANAGAITLTAAYVPVSDDEHLAIFEIDGYVEAYGAADGQTPSYREAQRGSTSSVPTKYTRDADTTYAFAGWVDASSGRLYAGTLPRANEDCRYVAQFTETPSTQTATFYSWKYVDGALAYASTEKKVSFGDALDEAAGEVAKRGDVVYGETEVYELLGWSPRRSDAQPLYTDQLPTQGGTTAVGAAVGVASRLYGIYSTRERLVNVTFVVDGEEYATAVDVSTGRTVNGAFSETGAERPADKSDSARFRGWALGSSDGTLLMGAVKTLAGLTEGEENIVLYAVFGSGATADEMDDGNEDGGASGGGAPSDGAGGGASGTGASDGTSDGGTQGTSRGGALDVSFGNAAAVAAGTIEGDDALSPVLRDDAQQDGDASAQGDGADDAAQASSVWDDRSQTSASEAGEEGSLGNTVAFFTGVVALICAAAGAAWHAWRNRRLDAEDDFYEPDASGDQGEQVTF